MITKKSLAIIMTAVTVGLLSMLGLSLVSAQEGPSASRSFPPASVAPGGEVVVTITATNYGSGRRRHGNAALWVHIRFQQTSTPRRS